MKPVIITAALTGSVTSAGQNPNLPLTVEEIVVAGVEAWRAGAAVLHVHAREQDGEPTQRLERYRLLVEGLQAEGCDAILNLSTGSAGGRATGAIRYDCLELQPEVGSFDCGSVNFGDRVFENPMPFLRDMARAFLKAGVKPEIECFEAGHIQNALTLRAEGLLHDSLHFQFVLGVKGGAPATIAHVAFLRSQLPPGATWSLCGIGRDQLPMTVLALISDGQARTGLEDNVYYRRGELAASNAQLVKRPPARRGARSPRRVAGAGARALVAPACLTSLGASLARLGGREPSTHKYLISRDR